MPFSQNFSSKTLKRTRKFVIDGVEVSVTTSKIIGEDEKKDEEMRFLRYAADSVSSQKAFLVRIIGVCVCVCVTASFLENAACFGFLWLRAKGL